MKRKIAVAVLSAVCVIACAGALAACGHTHHWSSAYINEGERHYQTCDGCDEKNYSLHDFTGGDCICGATKVTQGLEYEWDLYNEGYSVKGIGTTADTDIVVPSMYEGKPVRIIGSSCFYECNEITSIVLPESVTIIGNKAFDRCLNLASVTIGSKVRSIGEKAFSYCAALSSITVRDGNEKYHSSGNCLIETKSETLIVGCKDSVIPDDGSVTKIGQNAFYGCYLLTNITIPRAVTSIGHNAFYFCGNFVDVTIPDSVTTIEEFAFPGCGKLTIYCETTEAPRNWENESGRSWRGDCPVVWDCKNNEIASNGCIYAVIGGIRYSLKDGEASVAGQQISMSGEITIPRSVTYKDIDYSVTSIGSQAFGRCNLTGIVIPDSVTIIENRAFSDCSNLADIEIPSSVTSIEGNAFCRCVGLTSIVIPNTVASMGYSVFFECNNLTIFCEATQKPRDWENGWDIKSFGSSRWSVVWGYKNR